jgi:hypothetical protein
MKFSQVPDRLGDYMLLCPGCNHVHIVSTATPSDATGAKWSFNGDVEKPTISPSLLVRWPDNIRLYNVCHSFIKDGAIQFLSDCTHSLAGQTVALPDFKWPDE